MNILHISTGDSICGAMIAAHRLNVAMNKNEIASWMLVEDKNSNDPTVSKNCCSWVYRLLHRIENLVEWGVTALFLKASYNYSIGLFGQKCRHRELCKADIIYIHWTGYSYLNVRGIKHILNYNKPTFFVLHDMYHITGGCNYSFNCKSFQIDCSHCPIIKRKKLNTISARVLKKKKAALQNNINVQIIAPSIWMGECAKGSALFQNRKVNVIPNPLDTSFFKIIERSEARHIMNLSKNKKKILFGAAGGVSNPYKGWAYLVEALKKIKTKNTELVIFGGNVSRDEINNISQEVIQVGIISNLHSLMLLYNACDVFVVPSMADNYPQTVMESISCGTPVVGFDIGGIPDLVQTGKTGYRARYKDPIDLATGIDCILQGTGEFGNITRESLHNFAEENFSEAVVVKKHKELWKQIDENPHE